MATGGSTSCSAATGPSRTSDEAAPFSDDTVRLFQLVYINVKLVPRILHELFRHHYKDRWKVVWDDSAEKRTELAAEMENEEVNPEWCYDEVKNKSITLWDITTSCAALKVVWSENYLPQYITNVRDARNSVLHSTETEVQLRRFNEIKDVVQKLIYGAGLSLPREFCDDYQKKLDTLASSETFRKRLTNVQDVAELQEMLKCMMEDVRKHGEQGEKFSVMIEALTSKLQGLQQIMQCEHAAIQRQQEHQCVLTEQILATVKYISHKLEPKDKADMSIQKRRVISLFEAGNASLAREELPRIFPRQLKGDLRTSDETAAYAFALQHHPSLESVILSCPVTGSVNLQLLLDALFHHPTTRDLYIETFKDSTMDGSVHGSLAEDRAALCQFLRGKHRLAEVELNDLPVEVAVAALSTQSSTMEKLNWICGGHVDDDATVNLLDCLRSTSLRCITIAGNVGKVLLPILTAFAANTKTVDRTVCCDDDFPLDLLLVSQLAAELRQFLVPCVKCVLSMPLPVGVWGTLLSGVGDARQLERLRVGMLDKSEGAGPEWDHIDQPTLEEVERSWAHSSFWEVVFNISGCLCFDEESGDWYMFPDIQGSTLDATMKLLCAVVRGIIQREDEFAFKLQVNDEQVSRLVELEDIARNKRAVTRTESVVEAKKWMTNDFMEYTLTVLELQPLSSDQKNTSSQPPASQSRKRRRSCSW